MLGLDEKGHQLCCLGFAKTSNHCRGNMEICLNPTHLLSQTDACKTETSLFLCSVSISNAEFTAEGESPGAKEGRASNPEIMRKLNIKS